MALSCDSMSEKSHNTLPRNAAVVLAASLITGTVFLIFSLFHVGSYGSQESATTRIYFADNISPAHNSLIEKFNKLHKGRIEVVAVNLPFSKFSTNERKELLARSLRSKNDRLDIFAVDLIWVHRFARWAQPLDAYLMPHERNVFLSPALVSCYYEEQLVALPLYLDVGVMYYRDDLLRKHPDYSNISRKLANSISWDDIFRIHKSSILEGSKTYIFAAKDFEGLVCSFLELLAGQDASIFAGDSVQLNTPAAERSLQLLVDMVNDSGLTPRDVLQFDENQCYDYALANGFLFMRGWPGFKDQWLAAGSDSALISQIRMAPLPHFVGKKAVGVFGGWNLMISKYSSHVPESVQFIKFLMQPESQRALFEQGGYLPANSEVYEDDQLLKRFPELAFYARQFENGVHRPYAVDYTRISDALSFYLHQAIRSEMSVTAALQRATRDINQKKVFFR